MTLTNHLSAILCVGLIAVGQVLFKLVATATKTSGSLLDRNVVLLAGAAFTIYGVATLLWIALLRTAPLGKAYPYMALSFVLVALASWLFFHEAITLGHIAGLGLIVAGLLVIAAS